MVMLAPAAVGTVKMAGRTHFPALQPPSTMRLLPVTMAPGDANSIGRI